MATVWISAQLRDLTHGQETASVGGARVGQVIDALDGTFPGIKARLCDTGRLRPGIAVIVDGEVARLGLLQAVGPTSEVHFLPAIGGGCCSMEICTATSRSTRGQIGLSQSRPRGV